MVNMQQISRIADRYVQCLRDFDIDIEPVRDTIINCKIKLLEWHNREPLNFDVLENAPLMDFTHDLGGIMRDDFLMSARCALAYHPKQ